MLMKRIIVAWMTTTRDDKYLASLGLQIVHDIIFRSQLTTEPWTVKWCWILADSEAVTIAVNIAMIIIPTRIHTIQKIRAKNDLGARSPYLNSKKYRNMN